VRLLGKGELKSALHFEVYHATAGAVAAVEKAGGSVKMLRPVETPAEPK
jgi:large subunit ribosomal protein L15